MPAEAVTCCVVLMDSWLPEKGGARRRGFNWEQVTAWLVELMSHKEGRDQERETQGEGFAIIEGIQ